MASKMQGFGAMGLSALYGSAHATPEEEKIAVVKHAVDNGVVLINSATFYGPLNEVGFGENLRLLSKCVPFIDRSKTQLMVKICMDTRAPVEKTGTQWIVRGDRESVLADIDFALKALGVDYIDIIVLCRVDPKTPIEETVAAMAEAVKLGKAKHIGLSEASAANIRKAHAVHPIYCIEQEWSLWTRDIEEEIVPTCRELGIKIVAYAPLGRGFLTGAIRSREDLSSPHDFRLHGAPRFSADNLPANLRLVEAVEAIAKRKGISVGQLALAWVHAQGDDVIPIPGTSRIAHLDANLAARNIELTKEDLDEINVIFPPGASAGDRYAHMAATFKGNK